MLASWNNIGNISPGVRVEERLEPQILSGFQKHTGSSTNNSVFL